jgi:hypothetical protein
VVAVGGGTAWAAGKIRTRNIGYHAVTASKINYNAITAAKVKNNSLGSKELRDGSILTNDVRNGSLKAEDFAAGQLPKGDKGDKGDPGASIFGTVSATGVPGSNRGMTGVTGNSSGRQQVRRGRDGRDGRRHGRRHDHGGAQRQPAADHVPHVPAGRRSPRAAGVQLHGQLLGGAEPLRDHPPVGRRGRGQPPPPRLGDRGEDAAPVVAADRALGEPFLLQPRDDARGGALRQVGGRRELLHAGLAVAARGDALEHLELDGGQVVLVPQR